MRYVLILCLLVSFNTASAYGGMSDRQYNRSLIKQNVITTSVQNLSVMKFRKHVPNNFVKYAAMGEDNYTKRMLVGLMAAFRNNLKKNGRNYDIYFRADAFMGK